jgi:hypothetical protein
MITRGAISRHVLTTALVAASVTVACSGSAGEEGLAPVSLDSTTTTSSPPTTASTSTTTATEPPTSTTPSGKPLLEIPTSWESDLDEIFGRYLLYWDAVLIASGPPEADPNYPPLVELADPALYEEVAAQIQASKEAGEIIYDPENSQTDHGLRLPNPAVLTKTEGNEVVLQDCFINGWVLQTTDGQVLDDSVVAKLKNVKMKVIDGDWRVFGVRDAAPGSSGYQECTDFESSQ